MDFINNIIPVTIASSIEAFYRSSLNTILNYSINGSYSGKLFPNMHIQVPTRILYINGLKQSNIYFNNIDNKYNNNMTNILKVVGPGVLMSPISSILEACNVEEINKKPLYKRWTDGYLFRCKREIIFAYGLNNLSNNCKNYIPTNNNMYSTVGGSLIAGSIAGYLSHIPHILSTLKLMQPHKSYSELFSSMHTLSYNKIPEPIPIKYHSKIIPVITLFFPKGVMIRTVQITGSFIVLNGIIELSKIINL
jgi:hypothetical protein